MTSSNNNSEADDDNETDNGNFNSNHLIILSKQTRRYNRFRVTGSEICVKLKQLTETDNMDAQAWIENCIRELTYLLLESALPSDYIGLELRSTKFDKPLWLSFRPVEKFDHRDVLTLIDRAAQSGAVLLCDDSLNAVS